MPRLLKQLLFVCVMAATAASIAAAADSKYFRSDEGVAGSSSGPLPDNLDAPDTLLWYRLACTLPPRLPPQSLSEANADETRAIQADYRVVMDGLGACARTRWGFQDRVVRTSLISAGPITIGLATSR